MKILINIFIVFSSIILIEFSFGQDFKHKGMTNKDTVETLITNVFNDIENAIAERNVSAITNFLSSINYLSLPNGVSGYYSKNQAYFILQDFFSIYHPLVFKFNNINQDSYPYATGNLNYESKNKKGTAQVYISLQQTGVYWKITQLTIK